MQRFGNQRLRACWLCHATWFDVLPTEVCGSLFINFNGTSNGLIPCGALDHLESRINLFYYVLLRKAVGGAQDLDTQRASDCAADLSLVCLKHVRP